MSIVNAFNEWDPLEEVIVGRAINARISQPDPGLFAIEYKRYGAAHLIPSGQYNCRVIEETEEDLDTLVAVLETMDIVVTRPDSWRHEATYSTPAWKTDGQYNYCPRDVFLVIGDKIIEAPMALRCRQRETESYNKLLVQYLKNGAKWFSAPKPLLHDDSYCLDGTHPFVLREIEPVFDAANVLRLGYDILYSVSDSANHLGGLWLQNILGEKYKVHITDSLYSGSHIDTTISVVREGLVIVCGERVNAENLPAVFHDWEVIYLNDIVDIGFTDVYYASKWIGLNFLMTSPSLAIVGEEQRNLIRILESRGISVMPLRLRHARTLGGGFHCVTCDIRRSSNKHPKEISPGILGAQPLHG